MCKTSANCDSGELCVGTACETADDASVKSSCLGVTCGGGCCHFGQRCAVAECVIDLGSCTTHDDCSGDSYCDGRHCLPYGTPADVTNDPECGRAIEIGAFRPQEQCSWDGSDTPQPSWNSVYSTPLVADFNLNDDPLVLAPSLVFASFQDPSSGGILRIVDGRTCQTQFSLNSTADRTVYATNPSIGDLDGDGSTPEIVATSLSAPMTAGGLVAFERAGSGFRRRWYGRHCDQDGEPRHVVNHWLNNNGPSLYDLDDDGIPEVLLGRFVYDANGCILNATQTYDNYLGLGAFAVASDVDGDGAPELVYPDGVYDWVGNDWLRAADWAPENPVESERFGHVAVADFGDYGPAVEGPEIVAVSAPAIDSGNRATGTVRVMTRTGHIIFGPYALPGAGPGDSGRGGPPTVGDFDGDGRPEIGVAGGTRYTVFDLDCDIDAETGPGCERAPGLPRGVLWSRPSQDASSNVTGSSVFDFDADGVAEVVYGDECFLRIYRGTDGEVLFSQPASSGTGYELPVIADVDGDFNSEIVVATAPFSDCPSQDPIYDGISKSSSRSGVVVLRDALDRWAPSRPIWNQHAYSVTNVRDDGTIPRSSEWTPNASVASLNNFRMNAQGTLERGGAADLTVALNDDICGAWGETSLVANVCNRGTNPVSDGARVVFYAGDPDDGAEVACETELPRLLPVANCTSVACNYRIPKAGTPEIIVVVDPDGSVLECRHGNNRGVVPAIVCGPV